MKPPIGIGILISGGGTTFLNLHRKIEAGELNARIRCVIGSTSKAPGLDRARELGYPTYSVGRRRFTCDETYSRALTDLLRRHEAALVVLAGFLRRFLPQPPYEERCINIHPSLIPAFAGQGFYGMKVHRAVWERGCLISGCTVHLVNGEYDAGQILLQKTCALLPEDNPEEIRHKVFQLECEALPEAIGYFADERIRLQQGRLQLGEPRR